MHKESQLHSLILSPSVVANSIPTMVQPRQLCTDPYSPPPISATISSREIRPRYQRLRWVSKDQDHDHYQGNIDQPPRRSLEHHPWRSESGSNMTLEKIQSPPSAHPICSPSAESSTSTPFCPPRTSFQRSGSIKQQQYALHGEVKEPTETIEKSSRRNSEGCYGRQDRCSDLYDKRNSYSSLWSNNPLFTTRERNSAQDDRPKISSHKGFSVRQASHSQMPSSDSFSRQIILEAASDNDFSGCALDSNMECSPDKEFQDSTAGGCRKSSATEPRRSSESFEPSTSMKDVFLPVINEEGNPNKIYRTSDSTGNGSNRLSMEAEHLCDETEPNIQNARRSTTLPCPVFRSYSLKCYVEDSEQLVSLEKDKKDEIEIKTIAWKESKTAKVLNRVSCLSCSLTFTKGEEHIIAWENTQKTKAENHMKKIERKLEEKKAKEMAKTHKKLMKAHKIAESRKAAEKAKIEAEKVRVASLVEKIRSTRKLPCTSLFSLRFSSFGGVAFH